MTNAEKHGQKERMNSEKHREKHGETNVLMHVCLPLCLPMLLPVFLLINLTGFLSFFSLFICQFFARVIYLFIALMFLPMLIHNIGKHSWDGCDWQRKPTQTEAFATSKKIMLEQICLPKTKFLQIHFEETVVRRGAPHFTTASLQVLGLVEDAHPDALACRCLVTLAVLRSGCPLPWDFRQEFAWYVLGCPEDARSNVIYDTMWGSWGSLDFNRGASPSLPSSSSGCSGARLDRNTCQMECQIECQLDCQNICQTEIQ